MSHVCNDKTFVHFSWEDSRFPNLADVSFLRYERMTLKTILRLRRYCAHWDLRDLATYIYGLHWRCSIIFSALTKPWCTWIFMYLLQKMQPNKTYMMRVDKKTSTAGTISLIGHVSNSKCCRKPDQIACNNMIKRSSSQVQMLIFCSQLIWIKLWSQLGRVFWGVHFVMRLNWSGLIRDNA